MLLIYFLHLLKKLNIAQRNIKKYERLYEKVANPLAFQNGIRYNNVVKCQIWL